MITVACVYWKGSFRGRENVYTTEWVRKLKDMVARNLPIPHRFVCLSNVDVPCERIPLIHDWEGFWSKVELFRPDIFEDRVLYLDLDTLVLQDLQEVINYPSPFAIIGKDHYHTTKREGKDFINWYNSSVMVWDAEKYHHIYRDFCPSIQMATLYGDQDWIAIREPDLAKFPKDWIRKLRYFPANHKPPDLKIMLVMPMKNEIASQKYEWIKEIWK